MSQRTTISFFLLLLSVLFWTFLIFPKKEKVSVLRVSLLEKEKELESQKEYLEKLNQTLKKLNQYKEEMAKIEAAIPDSPDIPQTLHLIQTLATQSGLLLKSVSFSELKKSEETFEGSKLKEWQIKTTLVGDYESFKNFLSAIEKSARLIETENISLAVEGEKNQLNFSVEFKIKSY